MRWKLLRRRLSISAPRMIVRSLLPWPLRWALLALVLGFSAALALWAFEMGRSLAGIGPSAQQVQELAALRAESSQLRQQRDQAQAVANTAESLLKAEQAALAQLGSQLRALEAENLSLKRDLGFFERLLPATGSQALAIRGLQAEILQPGQLRFQLLVMQGGRSPADFHGRYELTLTGQHNGRAWSETIPEAVRPMHVKQYLRVEEMVDFPRGAVIQQLQVRVIDSAGVTRAQRSVAL